MGNLKEIRERIKSVKTTQQMTKAMKMVAAARLRQAQDRILSLRPYARKMQEIIDDIQSNITEEIESPYLSVRPAENILFVVITSNRGLCGGFNSNLLKETVVFVEQNYPNQKAAGNVKFLCIGRKAFEFFRRLKLPQIGQNHDVFADLRFESVSGVAEIVMKGFEGKEWDRVHICYNEFKNVVVQNRRIEQYLPIAAAEVAQEEKKKSGFNVDYIFEPDREEIMAELIPQSLKIRFFKSVLESNAGEQGARMTAMDNATENAEELLKGLKLAYNRARQATITTEILEIIGGAEALRQGS